MPDPKLFRLHPWRCGHWRWVLLCGIVGTAVLVFGPSGDPPNPGARQVVIQELHEGRRHLQPPHWRTRLASWLSASWRQWLRVREPMVESSLQRTMFLWFEDRLPRGAGPGSEPQVQIRALDSHGFENQLDLELTVMWSGLDSGQWVRRQGAFVECLPRRPERLTLRAYVAGAGDPAVRLTEVRFPGARPSTGAPTPGLRSRPAQALPTGEDFALERCEVAGGYAGMLPAARTWFRVPLTQAGRPGWVVQRIELADGTGNHAQVECRVPNDKTAGSVIRNVGDQDRLRVDWGWPLWSDEERWSLTATFAPAAAEMVSPEDQAQLRDVPVPSKAGITRLDRRLRLGDMQVTLLALVGEEATLEGREHDVYDQTTLELDLYPTPGDAKGHADGVVVLDLSDEQGRKAEFAGTVGGQRPSLAYRIPAGARTIGFSVATFRPRIATFEVKPRFRRDAVVVFEPIAGEVVMEAPASVGGLEGGGR